ncbi:DUF4331 family protein [Aquimarina agarivorans]|uniref:DUF4331 family protein n=1 Tax=Aquimarina agarivorans TaxID=980584 RepID=UPI000248F282|nr:DUF4331 family protein [Aquimarina agarivorans]
MILKFKLLTLVGLTITLVACSLNEDANSATNEEIVTGFDGTFVQEDRVGKPAINTALILPNRKDAFNIAVTKDIQANFSQEIEDRIVALSPAYTNDTDTNALGLTAPELAGVLANDVLTVSLTAPTTFFDGTNVLTGRNLEDDVIDTALLLIFGGEDGSENPSLTKDNVNNNDRAFRTTFPYLPKPW